VACVASQHGANHGLLCLRGRDPIPDLGRDLLTGLGDDLAGAGDDVLQQDPSEQPLLEVLALGDEVDPEPAVGPAVLCPDHYLLRDVDQAACEITGVRRSQRGVGEAFTSAVRRDEVLEHGQSLAEVGSNRSGDDLAARVGDETAHSGDLAQLHDVSACTRVSHHPDRVELVEALLHGPADSVGSLGPDLDELLAALLLGDDAPAVLRLDLVGLFLVLGQDLRLVLRRRDVLEADRDSCLRRPPEARVLEGVEHLRELLLVVDARAAVHEGRQLTLLDEAVLEREVVREALVEDHAPRRRLLETLGVRVVVLGRLALETLQPPHLDLGVDRDDAGVERLEHFVDRREHTTLTGLAVVRDGQVVAADDDVLCRGHDRVAVCRRQHVVRREHEKASLGLRLRR
jgi:hypothetical protein